MNTPSHWLMTVCLGKLNRSQVENPNWALGLGALAPDIPLYILSFGGIAYFSWVKNWPLKEVFPHLYADDGLYFNDPGWIAFHNLFHSPTSLFLMLVATLVTAKLWPKATRWFRFFLAACALHCVVDVLTHHDDGPLLFFPFDWKARWISPVSYWDPAHFGREFMVFEGLLDLFLVGFLFRRWRSGRVLLKPKEAS